MSCDDKEHLARLVVTVSLDELVEQVVEVELEAGAHRVPALVTVHRHVVCKHIVVNMVFLSNYQYTSIGQCTKMTLDK